MTEYEDFVGTYRFRVKMLRRAGNEDAAGFLEYLFGREDLSEKTLALSDCEITVQGLREQAYLKKCRAEAEALKNGTFSKGLRKGKDGWHRWCPP